MKRPHQDEESGPDPVWELLAHSPPPKADPAFASRVVRAARLDQSPRERGIGMLAPWALAGLATAVAAAFLWWPQSKSPEQVTAPPGTEITDEAFEEIQAVAEEELLLAATEQLADFSNTELITLLGF